MGRSRTEKVWDRFEIVHNVDKGQMQSRISLNRMTHWPAPAFSFPSIIPVLILHAPLFVPVTISSIHWLDIDYSWSNIMFVFLEQSKWRFCWPVFDHWYSLLYLSRPGSVSQNIKLKESSGFVLISSSLTWCDLYSELYKSVVRGTFQTKPRER